MKGKTNALPKVDKGIEILTLKLTLDGSESTSLDNATVIITDADRGEEMEYMYTQDGIVASIDAGHSYTITCKRKGIAMPPMKYNATSIKDYQRSLTLNYTTAPTGVYIYTMDEQLVESTDFLGTIDDVFGIYVGTSTSKLVFSKTFLRRKTVSATNEEWMFDFMYKLSSNAIPGMTFYAKANIYNDLEGQKNTLALLDYNSSLNMAHTAANNYIFPDGRKGFLAAAGQVKTMLDNIEAVNTAYLKIDNDELKQRKEDGDAIATSTIYYDDTTYRYSSCFLKLSSKSASWSWDAAALACYDLSV